MRVPPITIQIQVQGKDHVSLVDFIKQLSAINEALVNGRL